MHRYLHYLCYSTRGPMVSRSRCERLRGIIPVCCVAYTCTSCLGKRTQPHSCEKMCDSYRAPLVFCYRPVD